MTSIGIIGAGIAGLHLGLFLQQQGIKATIYTHTSAEAQLGSRLPNLVGRSAPTRERERLLGVNFWDSPATDNTRISFYVNGEQPFALHGNLDRPVSIVDMRIYCARLLNEFGQRGGDVVIRTVQAEDLDQLAHQHDLVVVAAGRGKLATLFPRLPPYSPFDHPQRLIFAGLFRGISDPLRRGIDIIAVPGHGEILLLPAVSFEPGLTGIAIEIIEGGAFDVLRSVRYEDEPRRVEAIVLSLLHQYAPAVAQRVDPGTFEIAHARDHLYTAITPTVRRGYTRLPNGELVLALGDMHVINDPITGQGANTASHAAWVLGEAIRDNPTFDAQFCQQVEERIWDYAGRITAACNARLGPPAPHVVEVMLAAAHHQGIANDFASAFNHPDRWWDMLSSPERTAAFLEQHEWHGWQEMSAAAVAA